LLASWVLVVLLTGYVGLASMLAGAVLVVVVAVRQPANLALLAFCIVIALFLVYTHRVNIARMRAGKESRIQRLWLFRSRAA
jgi:glycerol-3-phosphate acyltransferase PlsY